jgi:hypothetical protein
MPAWRFSPPFGDRTVTTGGMESVLPVGVRYGRMSVRVTLITGERFPASSPGNVGVLVKITEVISTLLLKPSLSASRASRERMAASLLGKLPDLMATSTDNP